MKIVKNCVTINKDTNASDALDWAKENCPSYITNDGYLDTVDGEPRYYFIFGDERDIIKFALRWS